MCLGSLAGKKESAVSAITTHLDNISEMARFEGMKVILEQLADQIERYPVLLMGDLNAEPTERVHRY